MYSLKAYFDSISCEVQGVSFGSSKSFKKYKMKHLQMYFTVLLLFSSTKLVGQIKNPFPDTTLITLDITKAENAKSLALDYIRILSKGENLDSLKILCGLPFSLDKKRIITSWDELKNIHQAVIKEKGTDRQYAIDTVFVKAIRNEILDKIVPLSIYYVIVELKVNQDGKQKAMKMVFAIQISENPRIVGIIG